MIRLITIIIALSITIYLCISYINRPIERPPLDKVYSIRQGVNEITLVHKPDNNSGLFSLTRAICSVFKKVNYMNQSFYYLGSGASISTPNMGGNSRYIVTEEDLANDNINWPQKIILSIVDTNNDQLLGRRELWSGKSSSIRDYNSRWGRHHIVSAQFVQEILNPDYIRGHSSCLSSYPKTIFNTKEVKQEEKIPIDHLITRNRTCVDMKWRSYPPNHYKQRASFANWSYKPNSSIDEVYCNNKSVFIFSSGTLLDRNLFVDWLSLNGELLGQFEIKYGEEYFGYRFDSILSATVNGNNILIKRLMTKNLPKGEAFISDGVISHITIDIDKSEKRKPWCKNKGEVFNYHCAEFVTPPNPLIIR